MFQENDSEIIRIENKSEKANENSEQVYIDAADETMEHFCNKKLNKNDNHSLIPEHKFKEDNIELDDNSTKSNFSSTLDIEKLAEDFPSFQICEQKNENKVIPIPKKRMTNKGEKINKSLKNSTCSTLESKTDVDKRYPDNLNPFENENEEEISNLKNPITVIASEYPEHLDPFDDENDELEKETAKPNKFLSNSLNPFDSESELEEEDNKNERKTCSITKTCTKTKKKKRPAPLPPTISNQSLNEMNNSAEILSKERNSFLYGSFSSVSVCSDGSISGNTEKSRTPTPIPRRSKLDQSSTSRSSTNLVDNQELSFSSTYTDSSSNSIQEQFKAIKNKKRPAPPIPAYKRSLKISSHDLDSELCEIVDQLPLIETQRFQLEKWLLENLNSEANKDEYKEKLKAFFDCAKRKCKLSRKQKELMYMKREIKLEETQLEVEYQLRIIMSKQDAQKTAKDREEEQQLLTQMIEIIDERNDIIENMIQDENKEIEEYQNMISKVAPKMNNQHTSEKMIETEKSIKQQLKFLKLKKLNKKIKSKGTKQSSGTKAANNSQHDNGNNKSDEDDGIKSINRHSKLSSTMEAVSNTDKNSKRKDFAILGRSAFKKLSNPSKTLQTVSNEIKFKFQHSNQQ